MHIQISTPLVMNPVCASSTITTSRRVIGRLQLNDAHATEHLVFGFDHNGEQTFYQVARSSLGAHEASSMVDASQGDLVWVEHVETMSYRAYDCIVIDGLSHLTHAGVQHIHDQPASESRRSLDQASELSVVDSWLLDNGTTWLKVRIGTIASTAMQQANDDAQSMGWIPLAG